MTRRRSRALHLVAVLACAAAVEGCASHRAQRREVETLTAEWATNVDEDSQEDLLDLVRDLGDDSPADDPTQLASLTLLTRLAYESPSALVRAESLRAAWRLASDFPATPIPRSGLSSEEFSERSKRYELLSQDPATALGAEAVELAAFLAGYRTPAETQRVRQRHAIELANLVVSKALWEPESVVQAAFAAGAAASARHALCLVTLYAADDLSSTVREEALAAARYLDDQSALDLIAGAFTLEIEGQVLHAGLDSLEMLKRRPDLPEASRQRLGSIVELLAEAGDISLVRRAQLVAKELPQ